MACKNCNNSMSDRCLGETVEAPCVNWEVPSTVSECVGKEGCVPLNSSLKDLYQRLCTLENQESPTEGGCCCNATEITYEELRELYDEGAMNGGCWYKIIDYQTIYDRPDYELTEEEQVVPKQDISTITSSEIEPLFVYALSGNQLSPITYSELYPQDILHYNIDYNTTVNNSPTKGLIYYREDTLKNVKASYDFRFIEFKRYNHSDGKEYVYYWDNGDNNFQLFKTFENYSGVFNVDIRVSVVLITLFTGFNIPNNVFKESCFSFYNNVTTINSTFTEDVSGVMNCTIQNTLANCIIDEILNITLKSCLVESSNNFRFRNNIGNTNDFNDIVLTDNLYPELFSTVSCEIYENQNQEYWYRYYNSSNNIQFVQIT
jgi:hypothetical protein